MDRYWDYEERERAGMDQDRVESLLAVELMERGVVAPRRPELLPVDKPEAPTRRYYSVQKKEQWSSDTICLFETAEAAQQMIDLHPLQSEHHWDTKQTTAKPYGELVVQPVDLVEPRDYADHQSKMKAAVEAEKQNKKVEDEYRNTMGEVEKATQEVWEDWHEQREKMARCEAVEATWKEYLALCDENTDLAAKFLAKAHSREDIQLASDWLGDVIAGCQVPPAPEEEEAVEA